MWLNISKVISCWKKTWFWVTLPKFDFDIFFLISSLKLPYLNNTMFDFKTFCTSFQLSNNHLGDSRKSISNFSPNWFILMCWGPYKIFSLTHCQVTMMPSCVNIQITNLMLVKCWGILFCCKCVVNKIDVQFSYYKLSLKKCWHFLATNFVNLGLIQAQFWTQCSNDLNFG